ncbi:MAG: zinc metallopeptidase, partial [Planctomycetota bacterium]
MGYYAMFDPLYWMLIGPTMLLALWAQMKVKSAFGKYSRIRNSSGMTGAQAAQEMLYREGVTDCTIEVTGGWLSDHYDPSSRTLRLSPEVYNNPSVSAVGIACHEAGHALQHAQSYGLLKLRSSLVPLASIGSWLAWPIIIAGMIFGMLGLAKIGIIVFSFTVIFQIVTLPVEFNASSRAKTALATTGIIQSHEEIEGVNKVLDAAAMTYVAATIAAVAQLLYYA